MTRSVKRRVPFIALALCSSLLVTSCGPGIPTRSASAAPGQPAATVAKLTRTAAATNRTPVAIKVITATRVPSATPASVPGPASETEYGPPGDTALSPTPGVQKLDMDIIFPPGAGRELLLYNCTACHSFVRIVLGQRSKQEWLLVRRKMRPNVSHLSDAEVDTLFAYAEANFNETKPVPDLPRWLTEMDTW